MFVGQATVFRRLPALQATEERWRAPRLAWQDKVDLLCRTALAQACVAPSAMRDWIVRACAWRSQKESSYEAGAIAGG